MDGGGKFEESEASDTFEGSFGQSGGAGGVGGEGGADGRRVQNRPYDEAVDLEGSLDESVETHVNMSHSMLASPAHPGGSGAPAAASGGGRGPGSGFGDRGDTPPQAGEDVGRGEYAGMEAEIPGGRSPARGGDAASTLSDSGVGGDGEGGASGAAVPKATYDPAEFAGLDVSEDIRGLFKYITAYKPHDIKLDTQLKPFIPDYIPSVGEMDAFLKPTRPDGEPDELGLKVLDEPAANQSDPTVLDLQLRALSKQSNLKPTHVRSIENAGRNEREIGKWIASIAELHRTKPAPEVHYTKSMPEVDRVMEAWPASFDAWLAEHKGAEGLPSAGMDLSLEEMARIACGLLDVPVYPGSDSSLIQSMHALFTVYHEFKTNPHFQQHMASAEGEGGHTDALDALGGAAAGIDGAFPEGKQAGW